MRAFLAVAATRVPSKSSPLAVPSNKALMAASRAFSIKLGDTDDKLDPRAGQKPELTVEMMPPHTSADQTAPDMLNESDSDYVQIHTTTNGICELKPGDDGEITIAELEFLMPAPRALVLIKKNRKMLITPKNGIFNQPKCGWKAGKIVAVEKTKTMTESPPSFLDPSPPTLLVGLSQNRKREGSVGVFSNVPTPKRPKISAPSPVRERLTVVVKNDSFSVTEAQKVVKDSHAEAKFPENASSPEASATSSTSASTSPETESSMRASDSPNPDINMPSMTVPMETEVSSSDKPKLIEASTVPPATAPMSTPTPPVSYDNTAPTHIDEAPSHSVLSPTFVTIASKTLETSNTATHSTKIINPPPTFKDSNSANAPEHPRHPLITHPVPSKRTKTPPPSPKNLSRPAANCLKPFVDALKVPKPQKLTKAPVQRLSKTPSPPKLLPRNAKNLSPKPIRSPEISTKRRAPMNVTAPNGCHPSMATAGSMIERILEPKKFKRPVIQDRFTSQISQSSVPPKVIPVSINRDTLYILPDLATAAAPWIKVQNVPNLKALMRLPSFCSSCSVFTAKEFQEYAHLFLTAFGPLARYWGTDFVIDHLIFLRQMSHRDPEDIDRCALGTVLKAMESERGRCEACDYHSEDPVSRVLHIISDSHLLKNVTTGDIILLKGIMQFIKEAENYYRFMGFPM
uniref:SH3 domain-containing protein n=1 Tax=Panagrellus redivivus TaxID=6233 RepID=A0A7E4W2E5_PANRE